MAEFAASIIGIVSAGIKVSLVLSQFSADVGSAGKEARMISNEIRSLCAVLQTLSETLEKVKTSPYYAHCLKYTNDMIPSSLEMFSELLAAAKSCQEMARGKDGKFGFVGRVQWVVFQKPKIAVLRAAIEAYKSNLALMLGTLNVAEKVTRRMSTVDTPQDMIDDEQDQSILHSLELEHRASLIGLEEAERQFREDASAHEDETHYEDTWTESQVSSIDVVSSGEATWAYSLVKTTQQEVDSLRASLSGVPEFDADALQAQVSRYSKSLSLLMTEDHKRLSQRWSFTSRPPSLFASTTNRKVLGDTTMTTRSPSTALASPDSVSDQHIFVPDLRDSEISDMIGSPSSHAPTDSSPRSPRLQHQRLKQPSRDDLQRPLPSPSAASGFSSDREPLTRTIGVDNLRAKPSTVFHEFRSWLLVQPVERRSEMLDLLTEEARNSGPKQSSGLRTTELIKLLQKQAPAVYAGRAVELSDLSINLGGKKIYYILDNAIEPLRYHVKRLTLSQNHLDDLPQTMGLFAHLSHLHLRSNNFKTIPDAVFQLHGLEVLDVSKNRLKAIPGRISQLRSLAALSVAYNDIKGLPFSLCKMEKLTLLKYQSNSITFPRVDIVEDLLRRTSRTKRNDEKSEALELHVIRTRLVKEQLQAYQDRIPANDARAILGYFVPEESTPYTQFSNTPVTPQFDLEYTLDTPLKDSSAQVLEKSHEPIAIYLSEPSPNSAQAHHKNAFETETSPYSKPVLLTVRDQLKQRKFGPWTFSPPSSPKESRTSSIDRD